MQRSHAARARPAMGTRSSSVVESGRVVVLDDAGAVGAVRELAGRGSRRSPWPAAARRLASRYSALRLDDCERAIPQVGEEVVDPLALASANGAAGDDDPAGREADLLADLLVGPARPVQAGSTYVRQVSASVGTTRVLRREHPARTRTEPACQTAR